MQIAIVDDRADDRAELSVCLENYMKKHQLDYTLTEFEDGENFLKAAAQVNFQLVFMDIYMENMDGMEAARRLRQKNRLCKIVFLTITESPYAKEVYRQAVHPFFAYYFYATASRPTAAVFSRNSSNSLFSPSYSTVRTFVRSRLNTPSIDFASMITRL